MSRKTTQHSIALVFLLLLGWLAGPLVAMDADWQFQPDAGYAGWTTYAWGPAQTWPEDHPLAEGGDLDLQIREAVESELARKGFRAADPETSAGEEGGEGEPDFRIVYRAMIAEQLRETSFLASHAPDVSWPAEASRARGYSEGTVLIEIAVGDEVVWSGWASDVAKRPRKLADKAEKAVRKILSRFPPKP